MTGYNAERHVHDKRLETSPFNKMHVTRALSERSTMMTLGNLTQT